MRCWAMHGWSNGIWNTATVDCSSTVCFAKKKDEPNKPLPHVFDVQTEEEKTLNKGTSTICLAMEEKINATKTATQQSQSKMKRL